MVKKFKNQILIQDLTEGTICEFWVLNLEKPTLKSVKEKQLCTIVKIERKCHSLYKYCDVHFVSFLKGDGTLKKTRIIESKHSYFNRIFMKL